jgi:hypothetical protein
LVLVTLLPYGILERAELAGLRQPSMAGALAAIGGPNMRAISRSRTAASPSSRPCSVSRSAQRTVRVC